MLSQSRGLAEPAVTWQRVDGNRRSNTTSSFDLDDFNRSVAICQRFNRQAKSSASHPGRSQSKTSTHLSIPATFPNACELTNDDFYRTHGAIWQLRPELAIEIADFGIGSDTPILLYYDKSKTEPAVINLDWQNSPNSNSWVVMADSFSAFVDLLGI